MTMIDESNFIDYTIHMIYNGNTDWTKNNTRCWRERKDGAKWRWMLDDVDSGFIIYDSDIFALPTRQYTLLTDMFRKLLSNNTFKTKFKTRFLKLLDTTFLPENVTPLIDQLENERKDYMSREGRWGNTQKAFNENVQIIREFILARPAIVRAQLNAL